MPEARIISYDSIYYHTAYGETPDFIEGIANNTVLDATYLPALVADGMQFMGWYSTHTFDDGTEVSVGDLVRDHSTNGSLHLYAKWSTITVSSVLTNLADEIRVLSGTTEPLGLVEMATNVNDANDEVADQTDLIAQLASALQGKSVPGGVETCRVNIFCVDGDVTVTECSYIGLTDGEIDWCTEEIYNEGAPFDITIENVVCKSFVIFHRCTADGLVGAITQKAQAFGIGTGSGLGAYIKASAGETSVINIRSS